MSNNSRPYRATITGPLRTTHYDYPSKEERGSWSHTPAKFTTVTSRKPVTRGEPVCWVNVYAEGHPASHRTKEFADSAASTATMPRLHCIPVYLPGEGAVTRRHGSGPMVPMEEHNRGVNTARTEVERLSKLNENLGLAMSASNEQLARDTAELADLRREVERLTKERDAAQRQADVRDEAMTRIRVAMTLAGIPEVEPYPEPGDDERERQLRAGGRCVPAEERLHRIIAQRDAAKAEVERLTRELTEARANGEAELASLRRVYAAAYWHYVPATNLDSAVEVHRAKFGPPETTLTLRGRTEIKEES